jgi:hypothetical protein
MTPWRWAVVIALLVGCVSSQKRVAPGIQTVYQGAGFGRVLFLPVVIQPNPSKKAIIDRAAAASDRVFDQLERAVVASFRNQPGVNGITPKALSDLLSANSGVLLGPASVLEEIGSGLAMGTRESRDPLSRECMERDTYLDFVSYCVSSSAKWKAALVELSKNAFNADAALILVITSLEKSKRRGAYSIGAGVAAVLVDLNNGRLVWGREVEDFVVSDLSQQVFPEWQTLFSKEFSEAFWIGFPGRRLVSP